MSLALCLIVKNVPLDIKQAKGCIQSVEKYVDDVYVTLNGPEEKLDKVPKELKEYHVSYMKWEKDFSKARTFNFKQAKDHDWILWLDADDVLHGGENLQEIIDEAEDKSIDGYWVSYWYTIDRFGEPVDIHPKVQLIRNDGHCHWSKPIHENLVPKRETIRWVKTDKITRIHKHGLSNNTEKHQRNLEIMLSEIKKAGDNPDPRDLIYAGKAFQAIGDLDKAEALLLKFIGLSGWNEEIYEAYMLLGELYRTRKDWDHSRIAYSKAIDIIPIYPDAYFGKALTYVGQEKFAEAIVWFENGMIKPIPEASLSLYIADITWRPLQAYAYSLLMVGRLEDAQFAIKKALGFHGTDDKLWVTHALIKDAKDRKDMAKSFRLIANFLKEQREEDKVLPLINAVPKILEDNIFITSIKNQYLKPKKWAKNEIAIFCPKTVEEWAPPSIKKGGIGGSETAVIEISKELTKLGWKVTVYNWCSNLAGVYNGVIYKNFWEINWKDDFNVISIWRHPAIFDADFKAKFRILDMHDVGNVNDFIERRLNRIDKIFVKTESHRELYPEIDDSKFAIINNGIQPDRFQGTEKRNPKRLIYTSTLDRGLETLLELFPKVKERVADAELHLFYGFKTYYELEKDNPIMMKRLKKVEKAMKQPGVINHGRVDQYTLAKEMERSSIWAYPTSFYEISCIGAMENQMAGCMPITSEFAALKETVKYGIKIEGDSLTPEYQKEWVDKVVYYLENPKEREALMDGSKQWVLDNFTWENIAKKWHQVIKDNVK